jgi:hypothetical protein
VLARNDKAEKRREHDAAYKAGLTAYPSSVIASSFGAARKRHRKLARSPESKRKASGPAVPFADMSDAERREALVSAGVGGVIVLIGADGAWRIHELHIHK